MEGTPIFDELSELLDKSQEPFGATSTDPRAEAGEGTLAVARPAAMIVIAGGRGVGKSTFAGTILGTDRLDVEADTDFGWITLRSKLVLYLFCTSQPPQSGLGGALGAVILVDAHRVADAFETINYFERGPDPFIVALNMFDEQLVHDLDEVREALALHPGVPLTTCDARDPTSVASVLQELVSHTMTAITSESPEVQVDRPVEGDG